MRVADHIAGDDIVLSVFQDSLVISVGGLRDGLLDVVVRSTLLQAACQVDNRDVGGRDTHGHAGELAVKGRDDLADGLGSTRGGRNDVLGSGTSTTPVLGRRTIDGLLGGGVGV